MKEKDVCRGEVGGFNTNRKNITLSRKLREANISLVISSYEDIFSDFDPRPYSEKALSEDFLRECRNATRDKSEDKELELRLLVPKNKRVVLEEIRIKKRLHEHFNKHRLEYEKEIKKIRIEGCLLVLLGAFLLFCSYLIYSNTLSFSEMTNNILLIITEPGGWFLFWIGGERFVYNVRDKKPHLDFYKKMSKSHIYFHGY